MAQSAPQSPSTEQLEAEYPLSIIAMEQINTARDNIANIIRSNRGFISIIGPCALQIYDKLVRAEAGQLAAQQTDGVQRIYRMPPWKPRSDPNAWHGVETDGATTEDAYRLITETAKEGTNAGIEIGHQYHVERYGSRLSFGWLGARNIGETALIEHVALKLPNLPLGIKNGLDGNIDLALANIQRVEDLRGPDGAPAVLIFRGGTNAKTPETWESAYREALVRTGGRLIVDSAHGGEMAFDPSGRYDKSQDGQIKCLNRILELMDDGSLPRPIGLMSEACDAPSPVDPVIPFQEGLALHNLAIQKVT
jgi:hypothetical protein